MTPWRDVIDWVGGYPFEVSRPEEVFDFLHQPRLPAGQAQDLRWRARLQRIRVRESRGMINWLFSRVQRPERGWDPVPADHAQQYGRTNGNA